MKKFSAAVLCSLLLSGCFGSDGAREADYEEGVFEFLAKERSDTDPGEWGEAAEFTQDFADELDELNPPDAIEDEHRRAVEAFREVADILRDLEADSADAPSAEQQRRVRELEGVDGAWLDAFAAEYGVYHYEMQGASMQPSLQNGDHLRVPAYTGQEIARGTIIVFAFHLDAEGEGERDFIKRVIGLPGDTIEVRDGRVFVDGVVLDEDYLLNTPTYTYGPKTVIDGHYFVLGDNRRNSYDSHQWANGCPQEQVCDFVPEENIISVLSADAKPYASTPNE